jgi:hypothetical protein
VGGRGKPDSSSLLPVDDAYMRRPDDNELKLFQLLPNSGYVPPTYTLAGVQSDYGENNMGPWRNEAPPPSRSVTALYTPDGQCEYQSRVLTCRLCILDSTHKFGTDIDGYHELKVADEFDENELESYTDWVDYSFTQTTVRGFDRTVFSIRKPILIHQISTQQQASRPVLVMACALQSTPWGCIETGALFSPDPEPGAARNVVTNLADTVANRADRLPHPAVAEEWPHLYDHTIDRDQLVSEVKATVAKLTEQPTDYQDEPGAILSNLVDRVQAESGITRQEVFTLLNNLEAEGEIKEETAGIIRLADTL